MNAPQDSPDLGGCELMSLTRLRDNPELLRGPDVVLPGIAWAGRVTLLAGREKLGKSTFLAAGVAAMSRGAPFLGQTTTPGVALWLSSDLEAAYDIDRRFATFNADPDSVYLATAWDRRPLSFLALVTQGRPRLVVVDTLASYAADYVRDPSQSAEWTPLLRDIVAVSRECGTAFVLSHHANKSGNGYRDSTAIGASVDAVLSLTEDAANPTVRRIAGRARWPFEDYGVNYTGTSFEPIGRELTLDARILLHIQGAPGTAHGQLRQAVGGNASAVDACLAELVRRGAVRDIGTDKRHRYIVVGQGETSPGQPTDNLSTGAPAGVLVCPSVLGDRQDKHGGSELPLSPDPDPDRPTACPDCSAGPEDLTWLAGAWQCEACARARGGAGA